MIGLKIESNIGSSLLETKSQYTLDIDQVCQLFPNILLNPKQNTTPISTTTNNTTMTSNDNELDGNESFQIAEEAEESGARLGLWQRPWPHFPSGMSPETHRKAPWPKPHSCLPD